MLNRLNYQIYFTNNYINVKNEVWTSRNIQQRFLYAKLYPIHKP
jgi:hypothetical protein